MTITRKYFTILAALLISMLTTAQAEETAASILSRTASVINNTPSIEASFVMTNTAQSCDGKIIIAKNKFFLSSKEMRVWFNGKTQWTWLASANEVDITEPTADEIMESNPFAIVNHFQTHYSCRKLTAPKGCYKVELTPKAKSSSIKRAIITINATNDLPEAIDVTFTNKTVISAALKSVKKGKAQAASVFNYDKKRYPAKSIVDLR
jgi:outer membrane lipoprotein-sorting protein